MNNYSHIESTLIHGGVFGDALTHSVNVPIYQTSTYQQFELEGNPKWEYSRTGNPTRAALEALIAELLTLENPFHCPHGRPTIISMSRYEMDRKFKRIV